MSNEVATLHRREVPQVVDPVPILDTARFEHMQRIANVMARSSMVPESLRTVGKADNKVDLPIEQVIANCFLVVNQAARWGMDPFSVVSCCAVVHGRLAYEGKLVAAVIDAKLGLKLHHYFTGEPASEAFRIYLSDIPFTPDVVERLKPGVSIPGARLWDGSVAEWKTTGAGTPWTVKNYKRMLIYRGTRDWVRIYESALMLGVYTEDELLDLVEDARARRAVPVQSLAERIAATSSLPKPEGFSVQHVEQQTAAEPNASVQDTTGGGHEVTAGAAAPDEPSAAQVSDSSQPGVPHAPAAETETDTPAPVGDASGAGTNSGESSEGSTTTLSAEEGEGAGVQQGQADAGPSLLAPGWGIVYAAALRRAQKKESLPKLAKQYWDGQGGWDKHKSGPDAATAKAIYDTFEQNFGNKAAIEELLRELI